MGTISTNVPQDVSIVACCMHTVIGDVSAAMDGKGDLGVFAEPRTPPSKAVDDKIISSQISPVPVAINSGYRG